MRKLFLFIFLSLFLISLVIAQPPFETRLNENGYQIFFPEFEIVPANTPFNLHIHVSNISDGMPLENTEVSCFVHLYNVSGNHTFESNAMSVDSNLHDWDLFLAPGNFTPGVHGFYIWCNSTEFGGEVKGTFLVTNSGNSIEEGNSSVLNITIIFFMILSILLFINFIIVKDKPQVKWTSFLIGFIFLLTALNIISLVLLDSSVNPKITDFIGSFVGISFLFYWFAFGLLAVIWFITILNTILFKQKLKQDKMFNPE